MSTELIILKELAHVTATQREWQALVGVIDQHLRDVEFTESFRRMQAEIETIYTFVDQWLQPFLAIQTQAQFDGGFVALAADYQQCHLRDVSTPRHAADRAFDIYLALSQRREFKTGYPLLKHTFARLEYFIDKYITNDAWLVMGIDAAMRRLNRFMGEVAELRKVDGEEACLVYNALMSPVGRYVCLLREAGSHANTPTDTV